MLVSVPRHLTSTAARWWAGLPVAAGLLMAVEPAGAQECETDADCGFGFECYSETLVGGTSTSGTTGGGGGYASGGADTAGFSNDSSDGSTAGGPELTCGDEFCAYGETWESCPTDCERYTYCAGAVCDSDADCAPNYTCQGGGSNAASVSSGTTSGTGGFCGDGSCDPAESDEQSCASDCSMSCQRLYLPCNADAECPSGYYCDRSQPGGSVGVTSSSGGEVYEWYEGTCSVVGTTGGSGGGAGAGGAGGSGGAVGSDAGSTDSSPSNSTGAPSDTTTGGDSAAVSGNGSDGTSSTGAGGTSGTGHDHGDGWHHWPPRWSRPRGGCSVGGAAEREAPFLWVISAVVAWAFGRRRRSLAD